MVVMFFMTVTTRIHMNPNEASGSFSHNVDKRFREREEHIDGWSNRFEVWKNKGIYETYSEVFGDAIREYNAKQKRKDRKIMDANGDEVGGYIQSIQTSRRGKKERVVYKKMPDGSKEAVGKRQESQGQRLLYELVCSAGNCEKARDDAGRILYTDAGHEIHPYRVPYEVNRAACRELTDRFEELYPRLKVVAAAFHGDEVYLNEKGVQEQGIEHVHINFIPVASGYKRGLPIQASISKALEQMGFKNSLDENGEWHNAYYYWTQDVQKHFEDIVQEKYAEYRKEHAMELEPLVFEHPARGKNLENLDPAVYRERKDAKRQLNAANAELKTVQEELEQAEMVIASKMQEADLYYADRKEEADALLRDAEDKHEKRAQEVKQRFCNILEKLKKVSDDLELYKKCCMEVVQKRMSLDIPAPAVERWMRKRKIKKNGRYISIYDDCMDEISPEVRRRAKEQYDKADTLSVEVRKQIEIAEEYMKEFESDKTEKDAGYGLAV